MGPFLPLLRIDVEHPFYADGRCQGLRFLPAGDTADLLQRAECVVHTDGGSLAISGPAHSIRWLHDDPDALLAWQVFATDEHFPYATDDAARRPSELLCVDLGATRPGDPAGLRTLQAAPRLLTDPFVLPCLGPGAHRWPPFAVIRVAAHQLPPAPQSPWAPTVPARYRWPLTPRATVWQYCLFGDWPEAALRVVDLDGQTDFSDPAPDRLDNGRPMLTIRSREPVPLAQRSARQFQLRSRQTGGDKVLIRRLPAAAARGLAREEINGRPAWISAIHVHR